MRRRQGALDETLAIGDRPQAAMTRDDDHDVVEPLAEHEVGTYYAT